MARGYGMLAAALLTGCAGWPATPDPPRAGDRLEQRSELTVPPAAQRLWVQDGRLGLTSLLAWRSPYCEFQFDPDVAPGQVIPPRRYTVTTVRFQTLIGAGLPHRVAGLLPVRERGDGAEHALFQVTLELGPDDAPLDALVCAQRDDLRDGRHPSRDQINATLGDHVSLLPGEGG